MKKSIRLLAMLLTLALMLGALSACGNSSAETTSAASEASEASEAAASEPAAEAEADEAAEAEEAAPATDAEAPAAESAAEAAADEAVEGDVSWPKNPLGNVDLPLTDEDVTVSIWMGVNPNVLKITDDIGNDCVIWNEIGERTGVHFEFTAVNPDSQTEKFNLMVASDDLTDIIASACDIYTGGGDAAIADEVIIDTLEYINEENTPQIQALCDEYPEALENGLTDSGYLAGMPCFSMQTESSQSFGAIIRQDWLDDLGLETPETYDELYEVLKAFKEQKGATAPLVISYAGTGFRNGLCAGYGIAGMVADSAQADVPFYQVDDQVMCGVIQPEFKEYLTMVNKWYEEGLIWQDFMSATDIQNPPTDLILADNVGVFYGEVTFLATLAASSDDPNFHLVAVPDFVQNSGDLLPFSAESEYSVATPWSISTQCEDPQLVMQVCNYFYTNDGATLCNYGIEGESFEYDENGVPCFTDLVLNNPDMSTTVCLFMYCMDRGPFYRDDTREQSGYTQDQKEASDIWLSNQTTGRSLGSTQLNSDETDQINVVYGDIKTYMEESILNFITGATSLDEFDAYVEHINDMGIDEVVAAYQEAYERYLSGETVEVAADPGPPPDDSPAP